MDQHVPPRPPLRVIPASRGWRSVSASAAAPVRLNDGPRGTIGRRFKPIHQGGLSGFIEHEIDEYILGLIRARGGASEQQTAASFATVRPGRPAGSHLREHQMRKSQATSVSCLTTNDGRSEAADIAAALRI